MLIKFMFASLRKTRRGLFYEGGRVTLAMQCINTYGRKWGPSLFNTSNLCCKLSYLKTTANRHPLHSAAQKLPGWKPTSSKISRTSIWFTGARHFKEEPSGCLYSWLTYLLLSDLFTHAFILYYPLLYIIVVYYHLRIVLLFTDTKCYCF